MSFWHGCSLFFAGVGTTWPKLGSQLGPQIAPKSFQEPPQIHLKSNVLFDGLFYRSLINPRPPCPPKIAHKSINKYAQQRNNQKLKKPMSYCNLLYNRALSYVMLRTNINKHGANIPQKTTLESVLHFGSILQATWLHFGKALVAKLEPSWHQIASKVNQKRITNMITF